MNVIIETGQKNTAGAALGSKKFFGNLLLPILLTCASISMHAQSTNYWKLDGNTQYGSWGTEYVNDPNHPEQGQGLNFWQPFGANHLSTTNYRLFLADNGKIGIGTQFPHAELSVNGTILAKEVRVTTNATNWPDNDHRPAKTN